VAAGYLDIRILGKLQAIANEVLARKDSIDGGKQITARHPSPTRCWTGRGKTFRNLATLCTATLSLPKHYK